MKGAMDAGNVEASVSSEDAARRLQENFVDLIGRVNMDIAGQRFNPADPISVEIAVEQSERSIEHHLKAFEEDQALQSLAPEIKMRFRKGIEAQATH